MKPASELPYGIHASCGRSQFMPRKAFTEWWMSPRKDEHGNDKLFESLIQFYTRLNLCRCGR